jgi:dsDNA-specific endonuclease/ATPase MutS2
MIANVQTTNTLFENRNKTVAKSFYRQLKSEGFSHEQIINLSTTLLALVSEDLKVFEEAS